jgi:hypothetical protein
MGGNGQLPQLREIRARVKDDIARGGGDHPARALADCRLLRHPCWRSQSDKSKTSARRGMPRRVTSLRCSVRSRGRTLAPHRPAEYRDRLRSIAFEVGNGFTAMETVPYVNHPNIAEHELRIGMSILERVNLSDKVQRLPAYVAGTVAGRLNVFGLAAEFRAIAEVFRIFFRGRSVLRWNELDAVFTEIFGQVSHDEIVDRNLWRVTRHAN